MNAPHPAARIGSALAAALVLLAIVLLVAVATGRVDLRVGDVDVGAELRHLVSMPAGERIGLVVGAGITLAVAGSIVLATLPAALLQSAGFAVLGLVLLVAVLGLSLVTAVLVLVPMLGLTAGLVWLLQRAGPRSPR